MQFANLIVRTAISSYRSQGEQRSPALVGGPLLTKSRVLGAAQEMACGRRGATGYAQRGVCQKKWIGLEELGANFYPVR